MEISDEEPFPLKLKLKLIFQIIFAFLTLLLAATLTIVISLESFTGIASTPPVVLGSCTDSYLLAKYSGTDKSLSVIFFTSVLSIIMEIAICILIAFPLINRVKPTPERMIVEYLLACCQMLSAIISFSKFLTFHIDLNSLKTTCTITYSQILITIILAISSASIFASILQLISTVIMINALRQQKGDIYKIISNLRNNTKENLQDPKNNSFHSIQNNVLPPNLTGQARINNSKHEVQNYQKHNIPHKLNEPNALSKKREAPVRPAYNHINSIQEEQSLHSLMKEEKLALGRSVNRGGPIISSHNVQQNQNSYQTQGYLSYIRKMNTSNVQNSSGTEGDLIAVIRNKYSK